MGRKNKTVNNSAVLNFLYTWTPVLIWAIVIFSFSASPTNSVSEIHWQDFIVKKTAHIVEYGIFAFLLYRSFRLSHLEKKKALLYSFLISVTYGITDEFHQTFTPGRESRIRDVAFDTLGSALSLYFIYRILPKSSGKIKLLAKSFKIV